MSEWLTTGAMIDRLKVGEVAESKNKGFIRVIKNENGSITHADVGGDLVIGDGIADCEWHILPNYVSFEEAMEALKGGKLVSFRHGNTKIFLTRKGGLLWTYNLTWGELFEGKWIIEN